MMWIHIPCALPAGGAAEVSRDARADVSEGVDGAVRGAGAAGSGHGGGVGVGAGGAGGARGAVALRLLVRPAG